MSDHEAKARELADGCTASDCDACAAIAQALREAHAQGQRSMRERAAGIAAGEAAREESAVEGLRSAGYPNKAQEYSQHTYRLRLTTERIRDLLIEGE